MKPYVLILSGVYDFSADLVCIQLEKAGVPFIRLNREYMHELRIALDPTVPLMRVSGHGLDAKITKDLNSVWFRQPVFLRNTPPHSLSPEEQLQRSQWIAFLRSLSVFDSAKWMNWPQATYLAESKPYQLLIAKHCGFKVPHTLIGNNAERFKNELPGKVIVKSLDTVLLRENSDCLFTYSTILDSGSLQDEQVSLAPLAIQEYVEEKTDVRVTIIDKKIYAVRILSEGIPINGDWRLVPKELLEYEDIKLPPKIQTACQALTRKLGLSFAAIDLLERGNHYLFLEINPTGEWGWLSNELRPIDFDIANWLAGPKRAC